MTTIDNILALADNYATLTADTAAVTKAREAMRIALTEALNHIVSVNDMVAHPVREPLQDALTWEIWLNAVDTANNTGRLVAYTYKEAIERAHNIRGEK